MVDVQLATNLEYGIPWLVMVLTVSAILAIGFFTYVILSTRSKHVLLAGFDKAKYELNKYHAERRLTHMVLVFRLSLDASSCISRSH
jgi:hypothetical protein